MVFEVCCGDVAVCDWGSFDQKFQKLFLQRHVFEFKDIELGLTNKFSMRHEKCFGEEIEKASIFIVYTKISITVTKHHFTAFLKSIET